MQYIFDHWEWIEWNREKDTVNNDREISDPESSANKANIADWLRVDSTTGFVRRTRKIRFAKSCAVILIPSRTEYLNAGINLWYDRPMLKGIQLAASREIKYLMDDNPLLTTEAAMAHLYQPNIDVIYRNVRLWFATRRVALLVVDKDKESALRTIHYMVNSQKQWNWSTASACSAEEAIQLIKKESGESGKRPHFDIVMIDESLGYMGSPSSAVSSSTVSTKAYGVGSNGFGNMATVASSSSGGSSKGMGSGYHGGNSNSNGHGPPHFTFTDDHYGNHHISSSNGEVENATVASSNNGGIAFKTADNTGRSIGNVVPSHGGGGGTSSKTNAKPGFGVGALVTIIRSVFGNSVFLGCTAGPRHVKSSSSSSSKGENSSRREGSSNGRSDGRSGHHSSSNHHHHHHNDNNNHQTTSSGSGNSGKNSAMLLNGNSGKDGGGSNRGGQGLGPALGPALGPTLGTGVASISPTAAAALTARTDAIKSDHVVREAIHAGCDFVCRRPLADAVNMLPIILATRIKQLLSNNNGKEPNTLPHGCFPVVPSTPIVMPVSPTLTHDIINHDIHAGSSLSPSNSPRGIKIAAASASLSSPIPSATGGGTNGSNGGTSGSNTSNNFVVPVIVRAVDNLSGLQRSSHSITTTVVPTPPIVMSSSTKGTITNTNNKTSGTTTTTTTATTTIADGMSDIKPSTTPTHIPPNGTIDKPLETKLDISTVPTAPIATSKLKSEKESGDDTGAKNGVKMITSNNDIQTSDNTCAHDNKQDQSMVDACSHTDNLQEQAEEEDDIMLLPIPSVSILSPVGNPFGVALVDDDDRDRHSSKSNLSHGSSKSNLSYASGKSNSTHNKSSHVHIHAHPHSPAHLHHSPVHHSPAHSSHSHSPTKLHLSTHLHIPHSTSMNKNNCNGFEQGQGLADQGQGLRQESGGRQSLGLDSLDASETSEEMLGSHEGREGYREDINGSDCGDNIHHNNEVGTRDRSRTDSKEDGLVDALMTHHPLVYDSLDSQDDMDQPPNDDHDDHQGKDSNLTPNPNQASKLT